MAVVRRLLGAVGVPCRVAAGEVEGADGLAALRVVAARRGARGTAVVPVRLAADAAASAAARLAQVVRGVHAVRVPVLIAAAWVDCADLLAADRVGATCELAEDAAVAGVRVAADASAAAAAARLAQVVRSVHAVEIPAEDAAERIDRADRLAACAVGAA